MHDEKDLVLPGPMPEPGFYYHYKHDPAFTMAGFAEAGIRNYAYEVLSSVGLYTEDDGPEDRFRVEYLPLYPWAYVYRVAEEIGRAVKDHRPLSMFMEQVPKGPDGGMMPRFRKITDPALIEKLTRLRDEMYDVFPPFRV